MEYGSLGVPKALLNSGANVEELYRGGQTSLHAAAIYESELVGEALIAAGARLDVKDKVSLSLVSTLHKDGTCHHRLKNSPRARQCDTERMAFDPCHPKRKHRALKVGKKKPEVGTMKLPSTPIPVPRPKKCNRRIKETLSFGVSCALWQRKSLAVTSGAALQRKHRGLVNRWSAFGRWEE